MEEQKLSDILRILKRTGFRSRFSSFQATLTNLLEKGKGKLIIQYFLRTKADISGDQTSESSAPRQIDTRTHKHIVQLLVNSAGNCYFHSNRKPTILHYASKYGWMEVVQSLLQKGSDPNVKDFYGDTPLMFAIRSLHKDVAELLIKSGADVLCRSKVNYTLLHAAAEKGWLEFVQSLLNKGVDPNAATKRGFTPLDFAVRGSSKEVVSLLMDSGADMKSCKMKRGTMLRYAATKGHVQVLRYHIEESDPKQFLISLVFNVACSYEQIETIEYLVKVINKMSGRDDTPLFCILSRFRANFKLVKLLIERGAYFNIYCYHMALMNDAFKLGIFQNVQICTQAIINKFNNKDLPDLYKLSSLVGMLPPKGSLDIKSPRIIKGIEESVRIEIATRGYCNVIEPKAIVLRMMAVKSYIDYNEGARKRCQLIRLPMIDADDHSYSRRETPCLDYSPTELKYFHLKSVECLLDDWEQFPENVFG